MTYNSKNYQITDDTPVMKEPAVLYETKSYAQKNEDLLDKLLAIGMKQCEDGLLIPHAEVMAEIKRKYNIS